MATERGTCKCKGTGMLEQQGWAWREGDLGWYWCECPDGERAKAEYAERKKAREDDRIRRDPATRVAELEARVATLTEERDAARSECGVRRRLSITLCDRAEEAEREAATLRSVLAPFAALADTVDDLHHEDDSTCPHRLKAGDIRRARAALAGAGLSTEGEG